MAELYHVGLDLHRRFSQVAVLDETGNVISNTQVRNNSEEIREYFKTLPKGTPVAVEATTGWEWLRDVLEEECMEVKLANSHKVKLIAESTIKTDKIDAVVLAQLERSNFLPMAYMAPKEIREYRELLRHRFLLVRTRVRFKNVIHSILMKMGILPPEVSDQFGKEGIAFLKAVEVPTVYRQRIDTYLEIIENLSCFIKGVDEEIKKRVVTENEQAKLLTTMPGISYLSGLLLVAEIGDINRFSSYKKLSSYAGLIPTTDQSAEKRHQGHIKKDSNKYIRGVLIEAVRHAIKKDPVLGFKYNRISRKKGVNKARIAIANQLLISVYFMLKRNTPYQIRRLRNNYSGNPLRRAGHQR